MLLIPSTERVKVREGRFDPLGSEGASAASAGPASAHPVLAFPRKLSDKPFNRHIPILLAQALSERAINSTLPIIGSTIHICQVSPRRNLPKVEE